MPYIDETVFSDQMRGLMVARGGYTSEKKKEEIKRYWYIEFRSCDEEAFVQVMAKLKFGGKSGDGFPSFRDFRDEYNIIHKPSAQREDRGYCGLCNSGRVFYRDIHKETGEVHDYVADCARCTPKGEGVGQKINPCHLKGDLLGVLRTPEALEKDRVPQEIKWPEFVRIRMEKKKRKPEFYTGLHPMNDPDITLEFIGDLSGKPTNGLAVAKALFGKSDPVKEKERNISLKRNAKEEEFGNVPY